MPKMKYGTLILSTIAASIAGMMQGCGRRAVDDSDTRYLSMHQDQRKGMASLLPLLIHDVHAGIKFAVLSTYNPESKKLTDCPHAEEMVDFTASGLNEWLDALRKMAAEQQLSLLTDPSGQPLAIPPPIAVVDPSTADIVVRYECDVTNGRSYTMVADAKQVNLYLSGQSRPPQGAYLGSRPYYYRTVLLHELGHAFGLADLYDYESEGYAIFGRQPIRSLMAYTANPVETLQSDDRQGLKWLYEYALSGKIISRSSCTDGFYFDPATHGCLLDTRLVTPAYQTACSELGGRLDGNICMCDQVGRPIDFNTDLYSCSEMPSQRRVDGQALCQFGENFMEIGSINFHAATREYSYSLRNGSLSPRFAAPAAVGAEGFAAITAEAAGNFLSQYAVGNEQLAAWNPRQCLAIRRSIAIQPGPGGVERIFCSFGPKEALAAVGRINLFTGDRISLVLDGNLESQPIFQVNAQAQAILEVAGPKPDKAALLSFLEAVARAPVPSSASMWRINGCSLK